MKRIVKSQAELKRLALAQGAVAEFSGGKFNTTMERVQAKMPPPPPPPKAEPAPAPVEPKKEEAAVGVQESFSINLDMEPVANAIDSGNEKVCKAIVDAVKEIHVPAAQTQPCSWIFKIKRDTRGFIESVEATPKQ